MNWAHPRSQQVARPIARRTAAASPAPLGVLARALTFVARLLVGCVLGCRLRDWFHGQRAGGDLVATCHGQREPKARALTGLAPCLQPALVQSGILDADRQPHPGATGPAHA